MREASGLRSDWTRTLLRGTGTARSSAGKAVPRPVHRPAARARPRPPKLVRKGYDGAALTARGEAGREPTSCSRAQQARRLRQRGYRVVLKRNRSGRTARQARRHRLERLQRLALVGRAWRHPRRAVRVARRQPAAREAQGAWPRPTRAARSSRSRSPRARRRIRDGRRPAVLYSSTQHAREWISGRGQPTAAAPRSSTAGGTATGRSGDCSRHRALVRHRRPTPTATSTPSTSSACGGRTCGTTTATARSPRADGVDPNRNFDEHWNYDNEGSSPRSGRATPTAVRARPRSRRPRRCRG